MSSDKDTIKPQDERNKPSPVERTSMALGALLTTALFVFTIYMGITAPTEPAVNARIANVEPVGDAVHVHVQIANDGQTGYSHVTVEVDCKKPAPSVTIPNLAANGNTRAVLVCPWNTTDPEVKLVSMIPA